MYRAMLITVMFLLFYQRIAKLEEIQCACTGDVWVSAYSAERTNSMGRTSQMKIKGYGEFALMRFDTSKITRKTIQAARLYIHNARPWMDLTKKAFDKNAGVKTYEAGIKSQRYKVNSLRMIGVSTISQRWEEGSQESSYKDDPTGHGASFVEASTGVRKWAWEENSDLSDVISSNGNTLVEHVELRREPDGDGRWWSIPISPALIQALVSGDSDGFAIIDESGQTMENNMIHSRESNFAPYLVVETGAPDTQAPSPAEAVTLTPAPDHATLATGAATLSFTAPNDAFCWFIRVNGKPWPRWKTPHPTANAVQTIILDGLKPESDITATLIMDDGHGNRTEAATVFGKTSPATPKPAELPAAPIVFTGPVTSPEPHGTLTLWVAPEMISIDPQSGMIRYMESRSDAYRKRNPVWDANTHTVRVFGCRGEFVSFQIVMEGAARDIAFTTSDFKAKRSDPDQVESIPAANVELFREWYVPKKIVTGDTKTTHWIPEIARPIHESDTLAIPMADNGVPNQKLQTVWVDLYIPKTIARGEYTGEIRISGEDVPEFAVTVSVTVYPFTMPDTLSFVPILNTYLHSGDPLYDAYRLAHKHRTCFYRTAMGASIRDTGKYYTPEIAGFGKDLKVIDWTRYDKIYGPILDGSAFKGLPRDGVPVSCFRLPINEDWPASHEKGYPYREPYQRNLLKPKETAPAWMVETHHALAGPKALNGEGYTQQYKDGFAAGVREFVLHAKEKGWTQTEFQCMSNSKIYYRNQWTTTAMWRYDEPMFRDDFLATAFQCDLFRDGLKLAGDAVKAVRFVYRQDISRMEWQFDTLDGKIDEILSGGFWEPHRHRRAIILRDQIPAEVDNYSSYGDVGADPLTQPTLCVASFLSGCKKTLQWQTFMNSNDLAVDGKPLMKADRLAILIYNKHRDRKTGKRVLNAGFREPVLASLRLKGLRRGQQDVELLTTLQKKTGYNLEQMADLAAGYVGKGAKNQAATYAEEAVGVDFDGLNIESMIQLRRRIMKALAEK